MWNCNWCNRCLHLYRILQGSFFFLLFCLRALTVGRNINKRMCILIRFSFCFLTNKIWNFYVCMWNCNWCHPCLYLYRISQGSFFFLSVCLRALTVGRNNNKRMYALIRFSFCLLTNKIWNFYVEFSICIFIEKGQCLCLPVISQ